MSIIFIQFPLLPLPIRLLSHPPFHHHHSLWNSLSPLAQLILVPVCNMMSPFSVACKYAFRAHHLGLDNVSGKLSLKKTNSPSLSGLEHL